MNSNFFSELFDIKAMRYALVAVFTLLALFLFSQTVATMQNLGRSSGPATDTITVHGSGKATLPPDVARISLTVQHTSPTVAEAQVATTKQTNTVIDAVKGQGVANTDVKTDSYTISPQYSYPNQCADGARCPTYSGSPKITGYQVSQSIQVTVRDLTKVGTLLEKLGTLEVQNVYGPNFALDDSTTGYDAARADAIENAKTQAKLLAKQLGVHLGKIVNFSESSSDYNYLKNAVYASPMDSRGAAVPSIPVGENTYNAEVSVTYEIR